MENTTDSLRALAPKWSLAGDEKLLSLLQDTHQKIVTKCREVNTKLDEMASALNTSSINLQNVNNRFMALSNSQFVESRVYDDDEVSMETKPIEEPQTPIVIDNITLLKRSLAILDNAHETAEILDESESDDSDAEISVVLKPRDAYAHRPLPHIIGSQAWKSKWHAGLIIEDSDSDSSTSKHDMQDIEQYSESDEDVQTDKHVPDTTISETSSSFHSERDKDLSSLPDKKQTPADIAAEIAARLGQAPPRVLEEPEDRLPQPTLKPVYRPQKPVSSTIFSDEPPPLETHQQFYSSDSQEDDDIFAEINKKQPYNNNNTAQNKLADDLFGRTVGSDFSDYKKEPKSAKQNTTLFDDESEPELFVEKSPKSKEVGQMSKSDGNTIKKPVGGISLFGTNKGTETIGADILKRNRRRSSSDTDSGNAKNTIKYDAADDEDSDEGDANNANNANYIFDNLFAKAKQSEEAMARQAEERPVKQEKAKEVKDLFSDNIFDDIDDIFTSNIKIPTKEANKNAKSIFDDDDDLFADIAKETQTPKATSSGNNNDPKATSSSNNKSLFDSDDELFSNDKVSKSDKGKLKTVETESQISKPSKENNNNDTTTSIQPVASMFDESQNVNAKESVVKTKAKSKSIFDSDSDDELFSDNKTKEDTKNTEHIFVEKKDFAAAAIGVLDTEKTKVFHSPSLFEEDEIDDLFINANKAKIANEPSVNTIIEHIIPENIPDFLNKVEVTEEIPVINKEVDETSKTNENSIPKDIENKKPVIVDTKPYVFPKIVEPDPKASESFDDQDDFLTNPKETKTVNTPNVMKDDVIETSQEPAKVQNKTSFIDAAIDYKLQEPVSNEKHAHENETEGLFADSNTSPLPNSDLKAPKFDKPVKEELDVTLEQKKPTSTAALFDDIFSEPPVFEKTKEIKKTINVNALFDDDSDDEALFFKKNDGISDEKPDVFSASGSFGLFNDEPPALVEVDSLKATKSVLDDDDLFSSMPEVNTTSIKNEWNDDPNDELISENDKLDSNLFNSPEMSTSENKTVDITTKALNKVIPDSDDELFSNMPVPELQSRPKKPELQSSETNTDEIPKDKTETDKKIGKLNTKNFNINVQALVPGASPKKIHKERNDDTLILNTKKSGNDLENLSKENEVSVSEVDNAKPKEAKSISFESKPESGVLDNNLSKQRAKIQVKRRPSSRRARHEAVRKSVIGLDDDTDNSSSFDEPLPKTIQNDLLKKESNEQNQNEPKTSVADKELNKKLNENVAETEDLLSEHKINIDNVHKNVIDKVDADSRKIFNIHDEITKGNKSIDLIDSKTAINEDKNELSEDVPESKIVEDSINDSKNLQSTTKVVYILNDEDIFSNKTDKPTLKENDELFKTTSQSDDLFKNNEIKTIRNTNKEVSPDIESTANITDNDFKPSKNIKVNKSIKNDKESSDNVQPTKKQTKSLFDLSDEEGDLFGKSTKTKKVDVKLKLFDSDSEEDLFSGKKKVKGNKSVKEVKKVKDVKKASLFGDDDDDDIFGVKTKTILVTEPSKVTTSTASKPTSSQDAAKSTETVFKDPLSMLYDD